MQVPLYAPTKAGSRMTVICFVSGSGTNYREIVKKNPNHRYIVFTNRPGCAAESIARENNHEIVELSHVPYLRDARKKYGAGNVPRNCTERISFEQEVARLIEDKIGGKPDLICMAGYDQWATDWLVDRYYQRILNVHPGDTTKGYDGLHWIPSTKAIIAGDESIRSTLFIVDKGEDTGPVLVQSRPLSLKEALQAAESKGDKGLLSRFAGIQNYLRDNTIKTYDHFQKLAGVSLQNDMELICAILQDTLKVAGDWEIYPFAVHELIAKGRVTIDGRAIYVDGKPLPPHGYRPDEYS